MFRGNAKDERAPAVTLVGGDPGATFRVQGVTAPSNVRLRLAELGFVPGAMVHVLGKTATRGLIVAIGDARIGLGAEAATWLHVERVDA